LPVELREPESQDEGPALRESLLNPNVDGVILIAGDGISFYLRTRH
jgi:hypothetical protein